MTILFIVESPGKIAKISSFLGKNYLVKASVGHFRDLDKKKMSIDFENNFEPMYVITKPDVVRNLKSAMKGITMVYLASDDDLEGEQIAESLFRTLNPKNYKRLKFNAITKKAILEAIDNAGEIDKNLVSAQKTRRVLDRLFGYLISPILQKQIGGSLSAGRVQSVAAKIVIDKENDIKIFLEKNSDSSYFKVHGCFSKMKSVLCESTDAKPYNLEKAFKGKTAHISLMDDDDKKNANAITFLKKCLKSKFIIHSIGDKIATRSPAPPFTTSTLQQEANRKFGMSPDITMKTAQKLYEAGYITYMRTDSVEISAEGHDDIKKVIIEEFGKEFYQKNIYKTKASNAQMAHEAVRPTHSELLSIEKETDDKYQTKLYKLIWQRTIASQMKPAQINVTTIQIAIEKFIVEKINPFYYFQSQIEKIIFMGFMKVYVESTDDPVDEDENEGQTKNFKGKLPSKGDIVVMEEIIAKQEYMRPPPRYSQASIVKKLEELGIGRPSTFVNTIKTIEDREYVRIGDIPGIKKEIITYGIKSEKGKHIMSILEEAGTVLLGKETKKIIPTGLGITVNDFLVEHFPEMMDYKFTAKMEEELDAISKGEKVWYKVVKKFYDKLKPIIDELSKKKGIAQTTEKLLGLDEDDNEIFATKTKFGPVVKKLLGSKTMYAKIVDPLTLETIKLKDAIKLFEYPKILGQHEKSDVLLQKGQFGFYLAWNKENYSLAGGTDINAKDLDLKQAVKIIKEKKSNNLAEFEITEKGKKLKAVVLDGKFGPYISVKRANKKINYPLAKSVDPKTLTKADVQVIISSKKIYDKTNKIPKVDSGSKTSKKTSKAGSKAVKKTGSKVAKKK